MRKFVLDGGGGGLRRAKTEERGWVNERLQKQKRTNGEKKKKEKEQVTRLVVEFVQGFEERKRSGN